jgi:hypothetical protein
MTFSILTLSINGLFATLGIKTFGINDTQHNSASTIMLIVIMLNVALYLFYVESRCAECCYAECRCADVIILSVVAPSPGAMIIKLYTAVTYE